MALAQQEARLKAEIEKEDRLSHRHPYSGYNRHKDHASIELPSRVFDRNIPAKQALSATASLVQPYPTGFTGHVHGGREHALGATYGSTVRDALHAFPVPEGKRSTQQAAFTSPADQVAASVARAAHAREHPTRRAGGADRLTSTTTDAFRPPSPTNYLRPRYTEQTTSNGGQPDTYGHARARKIVEPSMPAPRVSPGGRRAAPDLNAPSSPSPASPAPVGPPPAAGRANRPDAWVLSRH